MNFNLTNEQNIIVETVRTFLEKEIYPYEKKVDETGVVPKELGIDIYTNEELAVKKVINGEEFCVGCGRTREEIKLWSRETDEWREKVIERLKVK